MTSCQKCKSSISTGEEREHNSNILCEDCYIDLLLPPVRKMHYENNASFMLRLKDSYIACPQQYH